MLLVDSLVDSFEDRHLVLHGLLGLSSFSAMLCEAIERAAKVAPAETSSLERGSDPIVFLALGILSFGDTFRKELGELEELTANVLERAQSSSPRLRPPEPTTPDHLLR